MKQVLTFAAILIPITFAAAQMSPDEAQRILERADADYEPSKAEAPSSLTDRRAATLNETRPSTRRTIEALAAHCVVINGSVWCSQTWDERERHLRRLQVRNDWDVYRHGGGAPRTGAVNNGGVPTHVLLNRPGTPGFVDPYSLAEAPNFVRLHDGVKAQDSDGARLYELAAAMAQQEGVTVRSGRVLQVLDDGLLIREASGAWFADTDPAGYVDGDSLVGAFVQDGTYAYIDVLGARRMIERYRRVAIDADTNPRPATPDEVFKVLAVQDDPVVTLYIPDMVVDQSPAYRTIYPHRSGATGSKRELQDKGIYHWNWRTVDQPLDMRAQ